MGGSNSFRVDPEHVQALSKELQSVADDIDAFLTDKGHLLAMPKQAADPISGEAASLFEANAMSAKTQAGAFRDNLLKVVATLTDSAGAYQINDQDGQASLHGRS